MPYRFLIIDDEPAFVEAVSERLERLYPDALLSTAHGLASAKFVFSAMREPDLVLADFNYPDGDGVDFIKHFRAQPNMDKVPVILMSARLDQALAKLEAEGLEAHVTPLAKPEELSRLKTLVPQLLKKQLPGTSAAANTAEGIGDRMAPPPEKRLD